VNGWQPMLEQLARERYDRLLARARMLVGSGPDAEDLVHDALVSTFGARAAFGSLGEAEHYVRLAMASRCVDKARRRTKERAVLQVIGGWPAADAPDPADATPGQVLAALSILSPRQRACVVLRHMDDLSIHDTAHALGLSDGAVKRYTAEGVAALARTLGTDVPAEETAPVLLTASTKEVRRGA
jgi:RNA polymerase sigma factor (sigma-70 family)